MWQNRFWEHVIRDQGDLNRHIDYIHYNPVHHGVVTDPFQYPDSSAKLWLEQGHYQRDWGVKEGISIEGSFGE
jgi:putative transposase